MKHQDVELLAIGAGPSNLALAVALEELAPALAEHALIVERCENVAWQRGMLLPWTRNQVSFLKDLATLRNPRSEFTFLNFLHSVGRLDEFVNLATFTPHRIEISEYLQWVARSLTKVQIEYGRRCLAVHPIFDGGIAGWRVRLADESTITCRNLVIGVGRDRHVPDVFAPLPEDRVVHSTEYAMRAEKLDPDVPHRIAVIGAAQSAAEMLWASYQRLPKARCTMVMRSIGLRSYEHSKFTNELYYPSFIDDFYAAAEPARRRIFAEMAGTNYGALDPELLDTIYRQIYLDRLTGAERMDIITMADVAGARLDGPDVVLRLRDRRTGGDREVRCDLVLLGTGFSERMPAIVRSLAESAGLSVVSVGRSYDLRLPSNATATCHLQGVNEATHGIADSLLSVLAVRAGEIVTDVLARRGQAAAAR